MTKLKIAVYAICKNEEHFVDRWLDSMQEADMIVVTDTGSTDSTVEKLRARGAIVHIVKVDPWRFDVARNISLHFVPADMDVCVCTDLDEILEPGWRKKIEKVWTPQTTQLKYKYTWSFNPDGSRGVTFWYQKIHRRHGFRWVHPVHEILNYYGPEPVCWAWEETIQLNHYPDPVKSRGTYLPLLKLAVQEAPDDDRDMHYLGREYMYYGRWDKCIETLKKHLALPRSQWKEERSASMRYIAKAYQEKGDYREAKSWFYRAIAEAPHLREPYVELAKLAYTKRDWPTVYHMAEETLKIKERSDCYVNQAFAWDATIYDLGALSCYELGMFDKSYAWIKIAVELSPHNERLKDNLALIQAKAKTP
ncbi:tetratricopeptide repeat-containing glycosyltransferase [Desulforamulus aeronauticus]|uniref:Tetratricopeptide repeat-containing protein n=1 Tax=Desulforamulus aeronauticus DSM 10349 TaxID=1121421 RepID=A0A1M6VKE8_9FIRM|nr:glycosyltransferase [Desulforamulus aeronauticus]SHK82027.1 Tetratricopeptide repeat-containing protein [Desulforamulus aeronauticus DSM 10349]